MVSTRRSSAETKEEAKEDTKKDAKDPLDRLPTENEMWYVINTYFKKYGFVRHQLESFNSFITTLLPHIIQESNEIRVTQDSEEHVVTLCNVSVQRPTTPDVDGSERDLEPHMARLRGLT